MSDINTDIATALLNAAGVLASAAAALQAATAAVSPSVDAVPPPSVDVADDVAAVPPSVDVADTTAAASTCLSMSPDCRGKCTTVFTGLPLFGIVTADVMVFDDTGVIVVDSDKTNQTHYHRAYTTALAARRFQAHRKYTAPARCDATITDNYAWFKHVLSDPNSNTYTKLVKLTLIDMPEVTDADIARLTDIPDITLIGLTNVGDVSPLAKCTSLTLQNMPKVVDVGALASVQKLALAFLDGVTDVSALGNVKDLTLAFLFNVNEFGATYAGNNDKLSLPGMSKMLEAKTRKQ